MGSLLDCGFSWAVGAVGLSCGLVLHLAGYVVWFGDVERKEAQMQSRKSIKIKTIAMITAILKHDKPRWWWCDKAWHMQE